MTENNFIPSHQWTHNGDEVLILKCVNFDGTAYKGSKWPLEVGATIEAEDWNPEPICGGGFHGWAWGFGIGEGKDPNWAGKWIVYGAKPTEVVWVDGKCKSKTATIRFVGDWHSAMLFVLNGQIAWIRQADSGAASSTGSRGAASSTGDRGAASSTGDRGAASSTGYRGAASSTGDRGAASSTGSRGAASSTGDRGIAAVTGPYSTVEAGKNGIAAATCEEVTWIARPGAIFIHRFEGGCKIATFKGIKAVNGERITLRSGKIINRVKP